MSCGIAETASEIEKMKSESADYLNGLNSCGVIDWNTYNYAFDFYAELLMRAYEQGRKDAKPEPCEDAVSRKAVIDMMDEWKEACADSGHKETASDIMLIRKDFIELPPVTPKQRTGYWYPVGMAEAVGGESAQWGSAIAYHKCSECDEQALCEFGQEVLSKWCPHCGAKMERWSDD